MKTRSFTCLLAALAACNLALSPVYSQTPSNPPVTPTTPDGGAAQNTKSTDSTADQHSSSTGTGMNDASSPDKTNTKDTTTSLDKNPGAKDTDSDAKAGTKKPNSTDSDTSSTKGGGGSSSVMSDKSFMMKAAQGGMTEVELGKVAQDNASSADVKAFGAKMVTEHSDANTELKSLAAQKGVDLPTTLDAKHQAMVDKMKAMSGASFDKAYVSGMVMDHRKDAMLFRKASMSDDADVKAFASKTLMMVKEHLSDIEKIQAGMK